MKQSFFLLNLKSLLQSPFRCLIAVSSCSDHMKMPIRNTDLNAKQKTSPGNMGIKQKKVSIMMFLFECFMLATCNPQP